MSIKVQVLSTNGTQETSSACRQVLIFFGLESTTGKSFPQ